MSERQGRQNPRVDSLKHAAVAYVDILVTKIILFLVLVGFLINHLHFI